MCISLENDPMLLTQKRTATSSTRSYQQVVTQRTECILLLRKEMEILLKTDVCGEKL
jgi:hypothetical protein